MRCASVYIRRQMAKSPSGGCAGIIETLIARPRNCARAYAAEANTKSAVMGITRRGDGRKNRMCRRITEERSVEPPGAHVVFFVAGTQAPPCRPTGRRPDRLPGP